MVQGVRGATVAAEDSVEAILSANDLTGESIGSIRELVIPACETTPTSTIYPPTFTITPNLETIPTTPG